MFFYIVSPPISITSGLWSTGNTRKYQQIDVYICQCGVVHKIFRMAGVKTIRIPAQRSPCDEVYHNLKLYFSSLKLIKNQDHEDCEFGLNRFYRRKITLMQYVMWFGTYRIYDMHTEVSCVGRYVLKVTRSAIMNIIFSEKKILCFLIIYKNRMKLCFHKKPVHYSCVTVKFNTVWVHINQEINHPKVLICP